ncbi:MAG: class I SAM-dependent methyltransferase [Acidobacteriota bacterium]
MTGTDSTLAKGRRTKVDQVVLGNVYNKYESRNPVARRLLRGYFAALTELCGKLAPARLLEVGCGEGYLTRTLCSWWPRACVVGVDLSPDLFGVRDESSTTSRFLAQSVYELGFAASSFDLVVAAEVLEHLEEPEPALDEIERVARNYVVFSVPREPLWRVLNVIRLSYLRDWGNTPGHFQHWSASAFRSLIGARFEIIACRTPLPWTMLLARKKHPPP